MGHSTTEGFADAAKDGLASLRTAISLNLSTNHYPPIPTVYVEPVVAALEAYNEGDVARPIDITEVVKETGMEPRLAFVEDGKLLIDAATLIEITHSWAFTDEEN